MKSPSRSDRTRVPLAVLCLFAGLTAIGGGLVLVVRPDGSLARAPLSLLEHTPFHDFFVPGLLLCVVVGGINTLAGALVIARHPRADAEAMVSGAVLAAWIVIEALLMRQVHWLHGVYLALGLTILAVASAREKVEGELGNTLRALSRALLHAFVGWALCGVTMAALLTATSPGTALLVHALAAPVIFTGVAASYFRGRHAWPPLRAASVLTVLVGLFDLIIVASFILHSLAMFQSFVGSWLPLVLIFTAIWTMGTLSQRGPSAHEAHAERLPFRRHRQDRGLQKAR